MQNRKWRGQHSDYIMEARQNVPDIILRDSSPVSFVICAAIPAMAQQHRPFSPHSARTPVRLAHFPLRHRARYSRAHPVLTAEKSGDAVAPPRLTPRRNPAFSSTSVPRKADQVLRDEQPLPDPPKRSVGTRTETMRVFPLAYCL